MNILQILPELNVGGVETGTLDLAKYLVKLGHKAVVVSNGGKLVKELESQGAIHYQLPVHKKSIFTMIKMVPKLAEIIKKEKIDLRAMEQIAITYEEHAQSIRNKLKNIKQELNLE